MLTWLGHCAQIFRCFCEFVDLKKELKISSEAELKAEVSRLVDAKKAKNDLEKEYFKYAKRLAKDDP